MCESCPPRPHFDAPLIAFKPLNQCGDSLLLSQVFLGGVSGKEPACQGRRYKRHEFDPWVRKSPWRRAWQSTPVFLTGESHAQRSLASYSPWVRKESDMTEATEQAHSFVFMCVYSDLDKASQSLLAQIKSLNVWVR